MPWSSSQQGLSPGSSFSRQDFVRRVRGLCARDQLLLPGETVLVMVSGGQDSLALLHLLASGELGEVAGGDVQVLHVNHALRGDDSEADEKLVRDFCRYRSIPLDVRRLPVSKLGGNVQAEARALRRAAAKEVAEEVGAGRVALGHTLDDEVENLLYRVGRYGGLDALAGMGTRSGISVRPLLGVRRRETAGYCRFHGLTFARDVGNEDPKYARTGIRERVLPAWEDALPGAVQAAGRTAEVAAEASRVVQGLVEEAIQWVAVPRVRGAPRPRYGGTLELSPVRLLGLSSPIRRAVLHKMLEEFPEVEATRELVLGVERLLATQGWAELQIPGEVRWKGLRISSTLVDRLWAHDHLTQTYLDARAVGRSLIVRGVVSGDTMRPLGAPGRRAVKDIMVDRRVPRPARNRVPVVEGKEGIVWLGGLTMAEEGRIRSDTAELVRLEISWTDSP